MRIKVEKVFESQFLYGDGVVLMRWQARLLQGLLHGLAVVLVLSEQFDDAGK